MYMLVEVRVFISDACLKRLLQYDPTRSLRQQCLHYLVFVQNMLLSTPDVRGHCSVLEHRTTRL